MKRCPECRRNYYDDTLSFWLADDPFMDSLRDDPRYTDLLKRLNLP